MVRAKPRVRFRDTLRDGPVPITLEVRSTTGPQVEPLIDELNALGLEKELAAINITSNPTARVMLDASTYATRVLRDTRYKDTVIHTTCRDFSLGLLESWLLGAAANGVENITVMSGDAPKEGDYPSGRVLHEVTVLELLTGVNEYLNKGVLIPSVGGQGARTDNRYEFVRKSITPPTDFWTGAVVLPLRHRELDYAVRKRKAGARWFQTQITFDAGTVLRFLAKVVEAGQEKEFTIPIVVGCAPIGGRKMLQFLIEKLPYCEVPDEVQKRLREARARGGGDALGKESVAVAVEMHATLRDTIRERGWPFRLGAHVVPIVSTDLGAEIVRGVWKLHHGA